MCRRIEWAGVKLPIVTSRDFCTASHKAEYTDGSVILSSLSVQVPSHHPIYHRVAPRAKYERGQVIVGGWHLVSKPGNPGMTIGTWVNVSNPGGSLPRMLMNSGWSKSKAVSNVVTVKVLSEEAHQNRC